MAYYELEPFGEERADLRAAIIACTLANIWRGKGQRSLKPHDFMPDFDKPGKTRGTKQQTTEEMRAVMDTFVRAWRRK